jgi:voltage-gated potassium channel
MLRREFQRRLRHSWIKLVNRLRDMKVASERPIQFLRVMLEGPEIQLTMTVLAVTLTIGTIGFMILESWSLVDSVYMAVITLTTVGFGEVREMSPQGRVFTIMLIFGGVTVLAYGASSTVEYMVTGKALRKLTERQREEMMESIRNHYIVAGFGRVGREVALNFHKEDIPFVVIDSDSSVIDEAAAQGYLGILGSATEDDVMRDAGIETARGVVAAAGNDATNVYVVLTARGLNENLFIIARATDQSSESKLLRAGADRVTSPYILSGRRMATLALRPHVVDFLDITSRSHMLDQSLEEVVIEDGAIIANKTIGQIDLRRRAGANILAIYDANGQIISNPTATTTLEPGTRLIVLGTSDQLQVTEALAKNITRLTQEE